MLTLKDLGYSDEDAEDIGHLITEINGMTLLWNGARYLRLQVGRGMSER